MATDTTGPTAYRVKAADVQVLEWTGENITEMEAFAGLMFSWDAEQHARILTSWGGWAIVEPGRYVVCGVTGAFWIIDANTLADNYEIPTPEGRHPWDYVTGGDEDCQEGGCEDFYDEAGKPTGIELCSHVTPAVATFGDVYARERLESLVTDLRAAVKRGEGADDLLDTIDSHVYAIVSGWDDDVSPIGRGGRDIKATEPYRTVYAEAMAEISVRRDAAGVTS